LGEGGLAKLKLRGRNLVKPAKSGRSGEGHLQRLATVMERIKGVFWVDEGGRRDENILALKRAANT